jgi:oligosaccharide repeat unit polymerase
MESTERSFSKNSGWAERLSSPFVSMTPVQRFFVIGAFVTYLGWLGFQRLIHPNPITSLNWVFLALVLNLCVLLIPIVFYKPNYGWFHPLIFGIFLAFVDHLRRTGLYIDGLQWHGALQTWDAENLTRLVASDLVLRSLGLALFYSAFLLGPRLGVPNIMFGRPRHIGRKTLLAVALSTGVFWVYMQSHGGIINHILSWGEGREETMAGGYYWQLFIQLGLIACLTWLASDRAATNQPLFWGCAGVSLLSIFVTGGSRSSVIYPIVMGLLIWLLRERKIDPIKIGAIALAGVFLIGLLGNFRDSTFSGEIDWNTLTGASTTESSTLNTGLEELAARSGAYDGVFPILALVPNKVGFLHGSSYLAVLTLPIPRALWAEKPGLIDGMVGESFFHVTYGIPTGAVGEAFWNFGIPGIVIVFLLFGVFYQWLKNFFLKYAHEPSAMVLYVLTLFQFSDPYTSDLVSWLFNLVLCLLFLYSSGAIFLRGKRYI